MKTDKLLSTKEKDEMLGYYQHEVHSHPLDEKGWEKKGEHSLYETWPTKAHALHCAKARVAQGYRVTVYKIVTVSVADG